MQRSVLFLLPGISGILKSSWKRESSESVLPRLFGKAIHKSKKIDANYLDMQGALEEYLHISRHTPWGWLGIRGEGFKVNSTDWFKLDIFDENNFKITDKEYIKQIAKDFAQDFNYAEDAIITSSGNWYMSLGQYKQVYSTPPWISGEINTESFGLMGNDAPIWQLRFQEAKTWLNTHYANRVDDKKLRFFWPWGNSGSAPFVGEHYFSAIFSNNVLYRGLGEHMGLLGSELEELYNDLDTLTRDYRKIFIYDDSLTDYLAGDDFHIWKEHQNQFIIDYLIPMIGAVDKKLIDEIIIDDGCGVKYIYDNQFHFRLKRREFTYHYQTE